MTISFFYLFICILIRIDRYLCFGFDLFWIGLNILFERNIFIFLIILTVAIMRVRMGVRVRIFFFIFKPLLRRLPLLMGFVIILASRNCVSMSSIFIMLIYYSVLFIIFILKRAIIHFILLIILNCCIQDFLWFLVYWRVV